MVGQFLVTAFSLLLISQSSIADDYPFDEVSVVFLHRGPAANLSGVTYDGNINGKDYRLTIENRDDKMPAMKFRYDGQVLRVRFPASWNLSAINLHTVELRGNRNMAAFPDALLSAFAYVGADKSQVCSNYIGRRAQGHLAVTFLRGQRVTLEYLDYDESCRIVGQTVDEDGRLSSDNSSSQQ